MVSKAVAKGAGELWLTRYEEDSLSLLIEPRRAFVMYLAFDGDSGVTARDLGMAGSPQKQASPCPTARWTKPGETRAQPPGTDAASRRA